MAPTVSPTFTVLSFLLCLLLVLVVASATPEEICTKIVYEKHASVNYDFCVRILKTDPASATADERGIAVIAGMLGCKQARTTLSKIDALLKTASIPLTAPLTDCKEVYDEAADRLLDASAAAEEGNYSDANAYFTSGMDAADTCGDGFSLENLRSPLEEDDNNMTQICAIGTALTYTGP